MQMTKEQIDHIERICAKLDGWVICTDVDDYGDREVYKRPNTQPLCGTRKLLSQFNYTSDLNEIFRLVQNRILKKEADVIFDFLTYLKIEVLKNCGLPERIFNYLGVVGALLHCNQPALLIACALVKAKGRWKDVEDARV